MDHLAVGLTDLGGLTGQDVLQGTVTGVRFEGGTAGVVVTAEVAAETVMVGAILAITAVGHPLVVGEGGTKEGTMPFTGSPSPPV